MLTFSNQIPQKSTTVIIHEPTDPWNHPLEPPPVVWAEALKLSAVLVVSEAFQLHRQHRWKRQEPGAFRGEAPCRAFGAVVDGLEVLLLGTFRLATLSW